jgi:hypothetical protein
MEGFMQKRFFKAACLPLLAVLILIFPFGCSQKGNNFSPSSSLASEVSSSAILASSSQASSTAVETAQIYSDSSSPPLASSNAKPDVSNKSSAPSTPVNSQRSAKYITLTIDATKGNDGIVANNKQVAISTGDTVFSALKRYCDVNKILISAQKTGNGEYVSSIDGVAQFDNGSESGWIFCVGSKFPAVDCNSFKLSGGETVKWIYTTDDGKTEEHLK